MKPHTTLYLIATEADFRLIRGLGPDLTEVGHHKAGEFADVDHEFSAGKGRNRSGVAGGGNSFGVAGPKDEAEIERPRLARHMAEALAREWDRGGYDRIVIAAGPKLLGALRDALPDRLLADISAELHKDLGKVALHDLPGHFAGVSAV